MNTNNNKSTAFLETANLSEVIELNKNPTFSGKFAQPAEHTEEEIQQINQETARLKQFFIDLRNVMEF